MAIIAISVSPAIKLLTEEETICNSGLLWQIENSKQTFEYKELTLADFTEVIKLLEEQNYEDKEIIYISNINVRMRL